MIEKTKEFFDNRSKNYNKLSKWAYNKKLNKLSKDFLDNSKGHRAIEVGAGTGVLIQQLNNYDSKIAFDISKKMLLEIKDKDIVKICGDVHDMPFEDDYFDLIICRQLLHYCNLENALVSLKRVLKKNGLLHVVQMIDFKGVPEDWDNEWTQFRKIKGRTHLRKNKILNAFKKMQFDSIKYEEIIIRERHTWSGFFQKHNISQNREKEIKLFFTDAPRNVATLINLKTDDECILYDRKFGVWLLTK